MSHFLFKNTVTNYLVVIVRFIQGILVTRWMIEYLGKGGYGLWSLLWAIFAYALLLDFGFGVSVQKYTSSELYKTNIKKYNSIVSAIFSFHVLVAFAIIVVSYFGSFFSEQLFSLSEPDKLDYCRKCLLLFALGAAIAFPTGIFPEILVGLRKIYLRNYVNSIGKIIELIATISILLLGGKVISLIVLTICLWLGTNLSMALLIPKQIPGFRLSFKVDIPTWREVASFSWFVYLTSIAKLILTKSSYLVISICSGLPAVGLYQISGRLAELCYLAGSQYQENVRPITAALHAKDEQRKLSMFIWKSMRGNSLLGIFFMLPAFIFVDEAIIVLFNVNDPNIFYLSRIYLIYMFISLTTRQVVHSYLLMANRHKILSYMVMIEAVLNLTLNIALIGRFGVQCVLWDALLINFGINVLVLFPIVFRSLKLPFLLVMWKVYLFPALLAIPGALLSLYMQHYLEDQLGNFLTIAIGASITSGIFGILVFTLLLRKDERQEIISLIKSQFARVSGAEDAKT